MLEDKPIIALLAGSRKQEIKDNLPDMLKAASAFPDYQLVLAGAPGIAPEYYKQYVGQAKVKIIFAQTYRLLQHAEVALATSGTATLDSVAQNGRSPIKDSSNFKASKISRCFG